MDKGHCTSPVLPVNGPVVDSMFTDVWESHLAGQPEGKVYMDNVLPFGLRSASKLYNAVIDSPLQISELLDWVDGLYYFLLFGEPRLLKCESRLLEVRSIFEAGTGLLQDVIKSLG